MMWRRKKQNHQPPKPEKNDEEEIKVDNPVIIFELINNEKLSVVIEWPENCDVKTFAQVLGHINSGNLLGPQLAAASVFASRVGQPEKAMMIHSILDQALTKKKSPDKPLIPPSKVIANQFKAHGH